MSQEQAGALRGQHGPLTIEGEAEHPSGGLMKPAQGLQVSHDGVQDSFAEVVPSCLA